MMIKPGISELSRRVDSRYTLVTMAAKRARMIGEEGEGLVDCDSIKPVSIAVNEIAAGKVGYVRHEHKERYEEMWEPEVIEATLEASGEATEAELDGGVEL